MANKGLLLNEEDVERIISNFGVMKSKVLKNQNSGQTRYTICKNDLMFEIDIYFKKTGKVTVLPIGVHNELGNELKSIFEAQSRYHEIIGVNFSVKLSEEIFNDLIEYLSENIENITVSVPEHKGINGIVYKIHTNFGDEATVTYYKSTKRLLFHGYMMSIYSEIRSFILPQISEVISDVKFNNNVSSEIKNTKIESENFISKLMPTYINESKTKIKGLITDSAEMLFLYKNQDIRLSDYAPVSMPILKVLEYRIKEICLSYDIIIDDKRSFVANGIFEAKNNSGDGSKKIAAKNEKVIDDKYHSVLVKIYEYFIKKRHTTFHIKQQDEITKQIKNIEEAQDIIIKSFQLLEESCIK